MQDTVFRWSEEKNNLLKSSSDRISFEKVVIALKDGKILDIIPSPTHNRQECFVVNVDEYIYIVPFVKEDSSIFLKTIYPSRKFTKYYLGGKK